MSWIPFAVLAKKVVDAYIKYEDEQSARFRCRICWTNNHITEEHQHPQLSAKRRSALVRCQIALPFLLAAMVGIPAYLTPWDVAPNHNRVADPMAHLGLGSRSPNPEGTTEGK